MARAGSDGRPRFDAATLVGHIQPAANLLRTTGPNDVDTFADPPTLVALTAPLAFSAVSAADALGLDRPKAGFQEHRTINVGDLHWAVCRRHSQAALDAERIDSPESGGELGGATHAVQRDRPIGVDDRASLATLRSVTVPNVALIVRFR